MDVAMKNSYKARFLMILVSWVIFAGPLNVCNNMHAAATKAAPGKGTSGFNVRKLALSLVAVAAQAAQGRVVEIKTGTAQPGVSSLAMLGACHADSMLDVLAPSQTSKKSASSFDICTPEVCIRFEEGMSAKVCDAHNVGDCIVMDPWGDPEATDCTVDAASGGVRCVGPEKKSYEDNSFAVKPRSEWSGPQWAALSFAEHSATIDRRNDRNNRDLRRTVRRWLEDRADKEVEAEAGAGADRKVFVKTRAKRLTTINQAQEAREQAKHNARAIVQRLELLTILDAATIMYAMTTASQEELRTIKVVFASGVRDGSIDHKSYLNPPVSLLADGSKEVVIAMSDPALFFSNEESLSTLAHEIGHIVERRLAHRVHCFTKNPSCRLNAEVLADMCSVFLSEVVAYIGIASHTKSYISTLLGLHKETNLPSVDSIAMLRDESGNLRDTYFKGLPLSHPDNDQRITMTSNTYYRYKAILRHFKQQRTSKKR
jgi:hypothetical protein